MPLGRQAVILDASDEEKIESDERVTYEKLQQKVDVEFASTVADWSQIVP